MHAKRVCKDFEIKNFGQDHDLYFKKGALLLDDVFRKLQQNVLKILSLRFFKISFSSWISMASSNNID